MDSIDEIRQDYWTKSGKLLTALYHAAKRAEQAQPGGPVVAQVNGFGSDGSVVPGSFVLITSNVDADTRWLLVIGFPPTQGLGLPKSFDEAIDYDVPAGRPPFRLPVSVHYTGLDRFKRRDERPIALQPIVVEGSSVSWQRRHWDLVENVDVDWIVRMLVESLLLHTSPEAAALAARDGRWEQLEERCKRGGQAEVCKVRDRQSTDGSICAIKRMRYPKPPTSKQYQRFVNEIQTMATIEHPHIVRIVDYHIPDRDDATEPFYVMPWADATLRQAKDLKGDVLRVLKIGLAVADGLCAAHERGVIHRDVKPENVLLFGEERTPALADFGICFLQTTDDGERLTRTLDETVGSDEYVAPELRGGRLDDVDSRVDVYSLGKTLYAALAGGTLFPLERWEDARYDLRKNESSPALDHFYGLLPRMVATDPDDRFGSILVCRDHLRRAVEAVRGFVPYHDGMYAGPATPDEMLVGLRKRLSSPDDVKRRDRVREAIDDAIAEARRLVAESRTPNLTPEQQRMTAERAADFLMAGALPLVEADDHRDFLRLVSEFDAAFGEGHRSHEFEQEDTVRRAAAAIAVYGIAAAAWHLHRWAFLRPLAEVYAAHPFGLVYLDVTGGHSVKSWEWIRETLARAQAIRSQRRLHRDLDRILPTVAGVLALAFAFRRPPAERSEVFQGELMDVDFPALYLDAWPASLAEQMRGDPPFENEVAQQVFGLADADDLRRRATEVTNSLARAMAQRHNGATARMLRVPESPWLRWCGPDDRRASG